MGFTKDIITAAPPSSTSISAGQTVTVHCTGFGKNGDLSVPFWSTKDPGQQPFTFQIGYGKVIKAW